jgi:hypothetical protein
MDNIFIWMIAGATISLLGIFLVASERELKNKRRELEELKNNFGEIPASPHSTISMDPQENGISAELVAKNEALLHEVSSLSKKLEASESKLEQLETLRAHLNAKDSELTELRGDSERLNAELSTLKTRLESDGPSPSEAEWNSQKESEIADLKEQLETSQIRLRDLESARERSAGVESNHREFEELRSRLEASNLQLQNDLAAEQEKNKALETHQMQLSDLEQRYQELIDANIQLRQENSQLQQQLGQNQWHADRSMILRQRFEELRSKQAEISEQDRLIQQELVAISQFLDAVPDDIAQPESNSIRDEQRSVVDLTGQESEVTENGDVIEPTGFGATDSELHSAHNFDKANGISAEPQHYNSASLTATIAAETQVSGELSSPGLKKKRRRFGIFPATMGVLVVSGLLVAGFLGTDSEHVPSVTQNSPASKEKTAKLEPVSNLSSAAISKTQHNLVSQAVKPEPAIPAASPFDSRTAKMSAKDTTTIAASGKSSSLNWESYEVIQPTRVFSAPRADSQLVANVEPGTQVNVVDSRNGWLEIRSKHGRPPGFIPKAAAKRIEQN